MKANKIDRFFSKKLENHAATPSADAWSRLESELEPKEKKRRFIWWQFAAVFLMVLTIGGLFYNWTVNNEPENLQNENSILAELPETANEALEREEVQEPEAVRIDESDVLIAEITPEPNEKLRVEKVLKTDANLNLIANNTAPTIANPVEISIEKLAKLVAKSELENIESLGLVIPTEVIKPTEVIQVANYEVEIYRGLSKPDATTAKTQEKKSAFKKALEIAMDVKNGEIGLDDLRDLKDDLVSNIEDGNKAEKTRKVVN